MESGGRNPFSPPPADPGPHSSVQEALAGVHDGVQEADGGIQEAQGGVQVALAGTGIASCPPVRRGGHQEATSDPSAGAGIASSPPSRDDGVREAASLSTETGIASCVTPREEGVEEARAPSAADALPDADVFADAPEDRHVQEKAASAGTAILSDELRDQIVRQVEYYFSDENLPTDKFLLKFVKRDKEGYVPIAVIASFRRMKKLMQDLSLIEAALRTSPQLVVSSDGKKVKRLHPLPVDETKDTKTCQSRTVLVENLPADYSTDSIRRIFSNVGNIKNIAINDRQSVDEQSTRKPEIAISSKVHALVEYETVEAAESAVATLNDEKNWRSGMRVELLLKRLGKYGLIHKGYKSAFSEKYNDVQVAEMAADGRKIKSINHNSDMVEKEEEEQLATFKGGQKNRYRSRGRGHIQQSDNGLGHGSVPSASSNEYVSKPLPGPRMPDGTRGFIIGRGKPAVSDPTPNQQNV